MSKFIPADQARQAMLSRNWKLTEVSPERDVFRNHANKEVVIRHLESDPELSYVEDLQKYLPDIILAAGAGGGIVCLAPGYESGGVATLDRDIPVENLSGSGNRPSSGGPVQSDLNIQIEPGNACEKDIQNFLEALSDLNIALGGGGIDFQEVPTPEGGQR